jgi:hypothetical protein
MKEIGGPEGAVEERKVGKDLTEKQESTENIPKI